MKNRGFTLIELLIVVAIVGILVVSVIPTYRDYTKRMQDAFIPEKCPAWLAGEYRESSDAEETRLRLICGKCLKEQEVMPDLQTDE